MVPTPWPTKPPAALKCRKQHKWDDYKMACSQLGKHSILVNVALQKLLQTNSEYHTFILNKQINHEHSLVKSLVLKPKSFPCVHQE